MAYAASKPLDEQEGAPTKKRCRPAELSLLHLVGRDFVRSRVRSLGISGRVAWDVQVGAGAWLGSLSL